MYSLVRLVLSDSTDSRPVVAAFDVDGTLTTRDCVTPFLWRVAGLRFPAVFARHPLDLVRALVRRDRNALKALAVRALRGVLDAEAARQGDELARLVWSQRMRRDTVARLARHRDLGHRVVLVSASLEPYLLPLGAMLAADAVLCTRLELAPDGRLTGEIEGSNCRGPEKVRRLRQWLDENGLGDAELWAYGDSSGDDELLATADHPVRVRGRTVVPNPD